MELTTTIARGVDSVRGGWYNQIESMKPVITYNLSAAPGYPSGGVVVRYSVSGVVIPSVMRVNRYNSCCRMYACMPALLWRAVDGGGIIISSRVGRVGNAAIPSSSGHVLFDFPRSHPTLKPVHLFLLSSTTLHPASRAPLHPH